MNAPDFLVAYCFELERHSALGWVSSWQQTFPSGWIPFALVEALYQGRYKATSVEQILLYWSRRGQPRLSFSEDFSYKVWPDQELFLPSALQQQQALPLLWQDPQFRGQDLQEQLRHQALPARFYKLLNECQEAEPNS